MKYVLGALAAIVMAVTATAGQISGISSADIPYSGTMRDAAPSRDGSVWFIDFLADVVGRIDAAGEIKTIPFTPGVFLHNIIVDRDGNAWFTANGHIGRVTPAGTLKDFPVAANPGRLTRGADGAIWFIDAGGVVDKIGRMTPAGTMTEFAIGSDIVLDLTTGPDGNIWFIDYTMNAVRVLSLSGSVLASYPIPSTGTAADEMVLGPDLNIWFTHGNNIDRITRDGVVSEYPVPTPNSFPFPITVGSDGNIWFAEYQSNKLGQVIVSTAKGNGKATINESDSVLNGPGVLFPLPANVGVKTASIQSCPNTLFGSVGEKNASGHNATALAVHSTANCADLFIVYAGNDSSGNYDFGIGNAGPAQVTPVVELDAFGTHAKLNSVTLIINGSSANCPGLECVSPVPLAPGQSGIVRLSVTFDGTGPPAIYAAAAIFALQPDIEDQFVFNNWTDFDWDANKVYNVLPPEFLPTAPPPATRH